MTGPSAPGPRPDASARAALRPEASAKAANHLEEIDARYDAHVAALRDHAALAQAAADEGAAELAERLEPDPSEP